MDAVLLNRAGNVDQVFVDHGHKCDVMLRGEVAEDLVEGVNVVLAVVGGKGDAGEQDFDVCGFEGGENLIEIAASLIRGHAAQAVIAAELDDDDFRVQQKDGVEAGDSVFGGCSAGALIAYPVVVAAAVEIPLQCIGIRLPGLETVTGGDAVAEADQDRDGPVGGQCWAGQKQNQERNDEPAANVHINSLREWGIENGTRLDFLASHPCRKNAAWMGA